LRGVYAFIYRLHVKLSCSDLDTLATNRAIAAKYCMRSSHWHLLRQQKYMFASTFDVLVLVLKVLL